MRHAATIERLLLLMLAVLLGPVLPAAAQFETPNRGFHNRTAFPLDGRHRDVACESCHLQSTYRGTPTRCFDCHWTRRQDDRYRLQLGSQCEQCHRPTSWTAVRWDHALTGMPLSPAHRTLSCQACHQSSGFTSVAATCFACHRQDYEATRTPNHAAAGFPTTCETCHTPNHTSFSQATFVHAAFPLLGVHALQTCATCHRNGVYAGTPRTCIGCHRADYDRTTAPPHAAAGFPTTCESCHRPTDGSFRGGPGFNHNSVFALVGRHAQAACTSCHVNNIYRGTSRDCVGCHRPQYERTASPNHAATGFSTDCQSCHRAADGSWQQGSFNHRFPITSGPHRQSCTTCHQGGGNFQVFTCLTCHEHSRDRMDDKHKERAGYRYDSLACYGCHPTGRH